MDEPRVVMGALNPSIQQAEASGLLSSGHPAHSEFQDSQG